MSRYYVEYGALQNGAKRLIECDTSALPPVKISEDFARQIADALNNAQGHCLDYIPSEADLDELEAHAKYMQDHSIYGGGVLLSMIVDYRKLLADRQKTISGMGPGNQKEET